MVEEGDLVILEARIIGFDAQAEARSELGGVGWDDHVVLTRAVIVVVFLEIQLATHVPGVAASEIALWAATWKQCAVECVANFFQDGDRFEAGKAPQNVIDVH